MKLVQDYMEFLEEPYSFRWYHFVFFNIAGIIIGKTAFGLNWPEYSAVHLIGSWIFLGIFFINKPEEKLDGS